MENQINLNPLNLIIKYLIQEYIIKKVHLYPKSEFIYNGDQIYSLKNFSQVFYMKHINFAFMIYK